MQESSRVRVSTQILFFSPFFIHDLTDRRHDRAAEAGEASRIDSTHIPDLFFATLQCFLTLQCRIFFFS